MLAVDRLEFAPPPTAGLVRALGLAIVAHVLLVAALTWGVQWKHDAPELSAQAELWSALPQAAAPKLVEPPPPPPPALAPAAPAPRPAPAAAKVPDADIALERDRLRQKKEKQLATEKTEKAERAQRLEKLEKEQRAQKKLALEKQREQEQKQAEKLALDKKKLEQEAKRREALNAQQDAQKIEAQRQANLQRMAGLARSTGAPTASGTALQSSGPSASYGAKVAAKVKPNIVFTEDPVGNPTAVVEVRAAPEGTITSRKLQKSSGNKAWDEAVLKAIDKTETLPRDTDGRVPPVLEISFRPRD